MAIKDADSLELGVESFQQILFSSRSAGELAQVKLVTTDPGYACLISFWSDADDLPAAAVNHDQMRVELHYPYARLRDVVDMLNDPDKALCVLFAGPTDSRLVSREPRGSLEA